MKTFPKNSNQLLNGFLRSSGRFSQHLGPFNSRFGGLASIASSLTPSPSSSPVKDGHHRWGDRNTGLFLFSNRRLFSSDSSLPPHKVIHLPALSPTMEQGSILSWGKREGDQLAEGDLLCEIETDKATMGFETPEEGFLAKILIPAGQRDVPIGRLLCVIVDKAEDVEAFKSVQEDQLEPGAPPTAKPTPKKPEAAAPASSYPPHKIIHLPALSPTMEQGAILSWGKREGDELAEGDLLCEIETDKATMGFETPEEGFLAKILVPAGQRDVPIGKLLCIIVEKKDDVAAFQTFSEADAQPSKTPKKDAPPEPTPSPAPAAPGPPAVAGDRIIATPFARKMAVEKGVDLKSVRGSGPGGRILASDVEEALRAPPTPAPAPVVAAAAMPGAPFTDVPVSTMRRVIAKRLLDAKQNIPHYYLTVDIVMDECIKVREKLNALLEKDGGKLSLNDFVVKAAALACRRVPETNSAWMDTAIRQHHSVDVCVAVSTDAGLITPIVRAAHTKGLTTISAEVAALAKKARDGKLQPEEYQGGTFTVSNLGMFGVKSFTAIINPPQSCILAVSAAEKRIVPHPDSGHQEVTVMCVTLSSDHRVVDGAVGAQWLQHFKRFLEKPHTMLL